MSGYTIVDNQKIEPHITFIRINPDDIALTLREVFDSLSKLSWINAFDAEYIRASFAVRAESTVKYIADNIIKSTDDSVTSNSGEYVISELARKTIVDELKYLDIPLAELIKEQKSGNPGFDFYSVNGVNIILFGEAKYIADRNAYGSAFSQIVRFEEEERHLADLVDIDKFCCKESLDNASIHNKKGFMAAFAAKATPTDNLIQNIRNNEDFKKLSTHEELICIAVNI
ncbi:hypothetical protein EZS27_021817 [termite gut metagenome]|uniref:Anti-bacteriophage protein A/HamA C-terminal domain-containing protein n=1 Tax=termite gut metagenome TaxID=433724 RepID=A0A5J4R6T8_9ZZZZ